MAKFSLAIDIGASSGRHILGWLDGDRLCIEEVYRFLNSPKLEDGHYVWDVEELFSHILAGLKKCGDIGKTPTSVAIDTWGVDYVLLDHDDKPIYPCYCYRDSRTEGCFDTAVPYEKLYEETGIQFQPFNTIYQLLADKKMGRLEGAKTFLMLPEFFSFLLTGVAKKEYTNATTGGLVTANNRKWSFQSIRGLGLPEGLFSPLYEAGNLVGEFLPEIIEQIGYNSSVYFCASHDTASAVVSVPKEDCIFLSSGTWSLLGVEREPLLMEAAREAGYSNEGALNGRVRLLKNIMGLWLIQQVKNEIGQNYSFADIAKMAEEESEFDWAIDINNPRFLSPKSMVSAIEEQCVEEGVPVPKSLGEIAHCIFNSLAHYYAKAIKDLEKLVGRNYQTLCIVGGGSNNSYLNKLTAKYTGKRVFAGPAEATAIGNIVVQLIAQGQIDSHKTAKQIISNSFNILEVTE